MKYIMRIITLPFFAGFVLIGLLWIYGKFLVNYVRFGGEAIAYTRRMDRKTIADVFEKLVEKEVDNG